MFARLDHSANLNESCPMCPATSPAAPKNSTLAVLMENFPVFRDCRPLALGIHKAILDKMPGLDPALVRSAMKAHTASTRYLKALAGGRDRFDLDGAVAGEVTEEQRQLAETTLQDRFQRLAQRRREEEVAARQAKEEQQRQEKLSQLVARFGRR